MYKLTAIMFLLICLVSTLIHVTRSSFLENLEKPDVREIKMRLEEEKAKRLLLQNDVEVLMVKFEQLERNCKGADAELIMSELKTKKDISFSARLSAHTTLDHLHVITFDQVLHNTGNGYSSSTGIFKTPIPGTYVFALSLLSRGKGLNFHASIIKNDKEIGRLFSGDDVTGWPDQGSVTVVTSLTENDEVFVREFSSTGTIHGDNYCTFSGFLI